MPTYQMGVAAGGAIQQTIRSDRNPPYTWHKEAVIVFNVQILNTEVFELITGHQSTPSPITAETYAELGLPFFALEDKLSGISGAFDNVKSVAELDGEAEKSETFPVQYLDKQGHAIHPDSCHGR